MLVSFVSGDANFSRYLTQNPQRKSVEYRLRWVPPMPNLKFALPMMLTPDASQWNIGGVGSPTQNFCVGQLHFMLFMSIPFASGTQRKLVFQWNMGFTMPRQTLSRQTRHLRHYHWCKQRMPPNSTFNLCPAVISQTSYRVSLSNSDGSTDRRRRKHIPGSRWGQKGGNGKMCGGVLWVRNYFQVLFQMV